LYANACVYVIDSGVYNPVSVYHARRRRLVRVPACTYDHQLTTNHFPHHSMRLDIVLYISYHRDDAGRDCHDAAEAAASVLLRAFSITGQTFTSFRTEYRAFR
jgi:hypothetical protein